MASPAPIDFSTFGKFDPNAPENTAPQPNNNGNLFLSALKSGEYGLASTLSNTVAAGARLVGANDTATDFAGRAQALAGQAQQAGRSDIEGQGLFSNGIGGFVRKGAYEITKGLPTLATVAGAGLAAAPVLGEGAATAIGSRLPSIFTGGAAGAALPEAGAAFAGGAGVLGAQAAGDLYGAADQQARARGETGASQGDAFKSFALGLPIGAVQALVPASGAGGIFGAKEATGLVSRIGREAASNAAAGVVGSGLEAAASDSFNPNLSFADRAKNIVMAGVQGGAIGGLMGGVFGAAHGVISGNPSTADLDAASKGLLTDQSAPAPLQLSDQRVQPQQPTVPQDVINVGQDQNPALAYRPPLDRSPPVTPDQFNLPDQTGVLYQPDKTGDTARGQALVPVSGGGPVDPRAATTPQDDTARLVQQFDAIRRGELSLSDIVPSQADSTIYQTDKTGDTARGQAVVPYRPDIGRDPRAPVDTTTLAIEQFEQMRREATQPPGQPEAPLVQAPATDTAQVTQAPPRLDASPVLGPSDGLDPRKVAERDALMNAALYKTPEERAQIAALGDLYAPETGAPRGDVSDVEQRRQIMVDTQKAADRRRIQQMFDGPDRRVSETSQGEAPTSPRSIADRVTDAAHDLTGGTGGEAKIADIRKALPDLASEDIDNALKQIHGDDSDSTLTQAPKGQRTGVDGVSVAGQGKFHSLSVEARDGATNGVQERGAAAEVAGDQSRSGATDGGPDAAGQGTAGESAAAGADLRRQGAAGEPATGREATQGTSAPLAKPLTRVEAARALRDAGETVSDKAVTDKVTASQPALPDVLSRIKDAYFDVSKGKPSETVSLADLRAKLPDLDRATVDKGLTAIHADPTSPANLLRHDDPRQITKAVKDGAFTTATGDPVHVMMRLDRPDAAPAPAPAPTKAPRLSAQTPDPNRVKTQAIVKMREAMRSSTGIEPRPNKTGPALKSKAMATAGRQGQAMRDKLDLGLTKEAQVKAARALPKTGEFLASKVHAGGEREAVDPRPNEVVTDAVANERTRLADLEAKRGLSSAEKSERDTLASRVGDRTLERLQQENSTDSGVRLDRQRLSRLVEKENLSDADRREMASVVARQNERLAGPPTVPLNENLHSAASPPGAPQVPAEAQPDQVKPKLAYDQTPRVAGYTAETARADFKDATRTLKPEIASRVHIVNDENGLPKALRDQAQRQGLDLSNKGDTGVPAMYHKGEVYLRADMMKSRADIEDAIAHEVFGHMATAQRVGEMLGADRNRANFDASMSDAFDRAGGLDGLQKIAEKYGVWDGAGTDGVGLKGYLPDNVSSLTTHQKATLVDELIAHAAASTEVGPKQRALMEYVGAVKKVIADYLRKAGLTSMADRMDRFDENDVAKWISDSRAAMTDEPPKGSIDLASLGDDRLRFIGGGAGHEPIMPKMIRSQNEEAGGISRLSGSLQEWIDRLDPRKLKNIDASEAARQGMKTLEMARSGYGQVRVADIEPMSRHYDLSMKRDVAQGYITQAHGYAGKALADLARSGASGTRAAIDVQKLQREASGNNIDPKKSWSEHTWLTDGVDAKNPKAVEQMNALRSKHTELAKLYNSLGQREGGAGQRAYNLAENMQRGDNYAQRASLMQTVHDNNFTGRDRLPGFDNNSGLDFVQGGEKLRSDPAAYENYWKGEFDKRSKAMSDYVQDSHGSVVEDSTSAQSVLDDVKSLVDDNKEQMERMDQGPYFHQGRTGDYFVSAHLAKDADGNVRPETYKALTDGLEANKFGDYEVNTLSGNDHIFIRVGTPKQRASLLDVIGRLGDQDHLDTTGDAVRSGTVGDNSMFKPGDVPVLDRMFARLEARYPKSDNEAQNKVREQVLADHRAALVDLLPEKSIRKVYQQRDNVLGYSKDQLDNDMRRGQVSAKAIANAATSKSMLDAVAELQQLKRTTNTTDPKNSVKVGDQIDGYLSRAASSATRVPNSLVDQARGVVHNYYLAASPGYVVLNLSQVPMLTLPELGKKFGYGQSFKAILSGGADAVKVLSEIVRSGTADTAAVTEKVLANVNLSERQKQLVRDLENSGHLETGGYSRTMGSQATRVTQTKVGRMLDYVKGTATLSEGVGRMVAAFAADRLHADNPGKSGFASGHDYAAHVISESQFNWGGFDTPKLMSNQGPLGQYSPVAFQFHGFQTRLAEKIAYESYNGFVQAGLDRYQGTDRTAETLARQAEARRFMYAHGAASIFLAGSLGLPAAGWTAAAMTRLSGQFNDGEGYDVQAHFRNFLTEMFGKDMGEILARGVPRSVGLDMSEFGDKLLPFQTLLEDHRSLKDSMSSYLAQAWGSAPALAANMATSMQLVAQGRIGEAMAHALPSSLRNVAKAYRMSQYGYENAKGEKLPISATAADIVKQAIGLSPGDKAEYDDANEALENAKEDRQQHAGLIKQQLAVAMEHGDSDGKAKWLQAMHDYDNDPEHRGQPIAPTFGAYYASRQNAVSYARNRQMPVGTLPTDMNARNLIGFYNGGQ